MATKPQAKAAVDNAAVQVKADIDATLPTGVNLVDGDIFFNPTTWRLKMLAPDLVTAQAWRDFILAALVAQSRSSTLVQVLGRRGGDQERIAEIRTTLATYIITF